MAFSNKGKHIMRDILIISASAGFAYFLAKQDLIFSLTEHDGAIKFLIIAICGALFTTIFTLAPASVALVEISTNTSHILVALLGAIGGMIIDTIVVSFVRRDISRDLAQMSRFSFRWHFISLFHFGFLKWLSFAVGLLFISSPLPDELGLFFIGISKVNNRFLPAIFFVAHFIGIYTLISIAEKLS